MCGRYALTTSGETLAETFQLSSVPDFPPRFNIAPTQTVPAVIVPSVRTSLLGPSSRELREFRWGLIPFFAKDLSAGARMINARVETVAEKPAFRQAYRERRCLIPASGFLEWKREGKKKIPHYFRHREKTLFGFAGLYERWRSPDGDRVESCTILTTEPNQLVAPFHDRMPVILDPEDYDAWLDPRVRITTPLESLLRPFPAEDMGFEVVNPRVNNVRNDDPECLAPAIPED